MLFGNCKRSTHVQMQVDDGEDIERVDENKFLGVIIADKINCKSHRKHVQNKLSRSVSVLSKTKHILDHRSLHILYCSLVWPYLHYCAEVWGNTSKCPLQSLFISQKRATRIIPNTGYRDHTNSLFLKSQTVQFADLVCFQRAQTMYIANKNLLPGNIQKVFLIEMGVVIWEGS